MPTPYEPPQSMLTGDTSIVNPSEISGVYAAVGSLMSMFIFVGLGFLIFGMYQAFQAVTLFGSGDPKLLASGISTALAPMIIAGVVSSVGLIISIATVTLTTYRKRWFHIVSIIASCANLLFVPIGTLLGLIYLTILFKKRREFRKSEPGEPLVST